MKDIMGRELTEGKTVVTTFFGKHRNIRPAIIVGFTKQKVKLEYRKPGIPIPYRTSKFPDQLALV